MNKNKRRRCITLKNYVLSHQQKAKRLIAQGWTIEERSMFTAKLRAPAEQRKQP